MRARLILVALGLVALTIVSLGLQAQPPAGSSQDSKDDIVTNEQQLARQFAEFQDMLLRLKQRLARGTPEERKRAEVLDKVLEECKNLAINQEFNKMLELLRGAKTNSTDDLARLQLQSETIAKNLRKILDMMQDSKGDRLSQDRKDLEKIIKDLERAINVQKQVQGQTDLGKTDPNELKENQTSVTKKTAKVEDDIQKYLDKDNKNGEAANMKGSQKDPGKGDGKKGETKDAGKQPSDGKKGETRDAGKETKGGPKGEAKPADGGKKAPDGDPKAGSKSGEKSGAEPKEAGAKGSKPGDPKKDGAQGSAKENKSGEQKPGQQGAAKDAGDPKKAGPQGSAKGDDKKPAGEQAKGGPPETKAKPGNPDAKQQAGAKEAKGGEKASESKAGGDPKQGEAKAGDTKDGQGQAKDGGSPPPAGQQPPPGGRAAQKSDGQAPQAPPSANKQDQDVAASAKKIKEAGYDQKSAENNITKGDNPQASKQQGDAIDKMEAAKKKLERLLQQLREEEIERVLAALQARCEKMLMMQQQVLAGTQDTEKIIQRNSDKKPTRENKLEALKLADKEKEIVQEANKCIDILEAEGSAVAFPEVFQQIRQDMIQVQKRLEITDVADLTQGIERDIIDTLKEMIEALKKARQENSDPSKSKAGPPGKAGDQKLLELIQELKMVRSLQQKVNKRTTENGKRYPGEQANDPEVIRELRQLSERQMRIQEIVSRISKGDNK
jgi:hypothetical protein